MSEPADRQAYTELEHLVRNLGEEIANFRRRAQAAEAVGQAVADAGQRRVRLARAVAEPL